MRTKEQISEYNKFYRLQNPERIRELKRQFRRDNPDKIREYRRRYSIAHPKDDMQRRNARLKNYYGITLDDYNTLLAEQNEVCRICGLPERILDHRTKKPKYLSVDHDHITGQIRGLLCGNCNKNIGVIENKDFMKKAISYLKYYKNKEN